MLVEGTIPIQEVSTLAATDDPAAAVQAFMVEHPGARVETVDGSFVQGLCACGTPVMADDKAYDFNPERGAYVCPSCRVAQKTGT